MEVINTKIILGSVFAMIFAVTLVSATPGMNNPSFLENDPLSPVVPLHEWRRLGNNQINGYQYDSEGNLLYVVRGVEGVADSVMQLPNGGHKFLINKDTVPKNAAFSNGYVHFHPSATQNVNQEGIEGFFLKHTAVTTGFEFPAGRMVNQQGIDFGFPNNYELI